MQSFLRLTRLFLHFLTRKPSTHTKCLPPYTQKRDAQSLMRTRLSDSSTPVTQVPSDLKTAILIISDR